MRTIWLVMLAAWGACTESNVTVCDGFVCPAQTVCDNLHDKCVVPDQLRTCVGIADGVACEIEGRPNGVCRNAVCLVAGCGDGYVDGSEQCDGDLIPADRDECTENGYYAGGPVGCNDDCTLALGACSGRCGDGVLDENEACDYASPATTADDLLGNQTCTDFGFYDTPGLKCSFACTFSVEDCTGFCGDGVQNGSEACDGSDLGAVTACDDLGFYDTDPVSCTKGCTYDVTSCDDFCGDGVKNGSEACDPGASPDPSDDDLGNEDCTSFGFYDPAGLACSAACTFVTTGCQRTCGDGVRDPEESCDDNGTPQPDDDVFGNADCTDLGYYNPTTLRCTPACGYDDSQCSGYCGDRTLNGPELCEGGPPTGDSCLLYGFESGALDCLSLCAPDFKDCHRPGWSGGSLGSGMLRDAWASAPDDVFAVGESGVILHYDGVQWTSMSSGTQEHLIAVYGLSPTNVYAVGEAGTILHYTASGWAPMTSGTTVPLLDVWAPSPVAVFAVGASGTILFNDGGNTWSAMDTGGETGWFFGVWGASATDVFVAGDNGIRRLVGSSWQSVSTLLNYRVLWGSGVNDIYAVGSPGVLHWDGVSWSPVDLGGGSANFIDVWGAASDDVYILGPSGRVHHWNGVTWTFNDAGAPLDGLTGSSPADIIGVGMNLTIRRYDAEYWRSAPQNGADYTDVWVANPRAAFAVGNSNILELVGNTWRNVLMLDNSGPPFLRAVWGAASDDVFAVGVGGVVAHRDATGWSLMTQTQTTADLLAVWGTSSTNLIAVGANGTVLSYTGTWDTPISLGAFTLRGAWGASATDTLVVGDGGRIFHRTTGSWTQVSLPMTMTKNLHDVWGTNGEVYVVGDEGTVLHYDGSSWMQLPAFTALDLRGVWGTGPGDVYVAGLGGTMFHFDGAQWAPMALSTPFGINAIHGAQSEVFAAGVAMLRRPRVCLASEVRCGDNRDDDCDGRFDCADPDCASAPECTGTNAGGACAGFVDVVCNAAPALLTTVGLPNRIDRYACGSLAETGNELAYRLPPGTAGTITATLTPVNPRADLDLFVVTAGPGGGCEVRAPGCVTASSTGAATENVTFTADPAKQYFLIVDGYGNSAGDHTLEVSCN